MRAYCLVYDPRQRLSLYATDEGKIVAINDEALSLWQSQFAPNLRVTVLPAGTRIVKYWEAGHKLGDWPSDPKWYYDPSRITVWDIPLDEYKMFGWHFWAKWLMAWGKDEWVFADPYREEGVVM